MLQEDDKWGVATHALHGHSFATFYNFKTQKIVMHGSATKALTLAKNFATKAVNWVSASCPMYPALPPHSTGRVSHQPIRTAWSTQLPMACCLTAG